VVTPDFNELALSQLLIDTWHSSMQKYMSPRINETTPYPRLLLHVKNCQHIKKSLQFIKSARKLKSAQAIHHALLLPEALLFFRNLRAAFSSSDLFDVNGSPLRPWVT
jgi:hypothetical protein